MYEVSWSCRSQVEGLIVEDRRFVTSDLIYHPSTTQFRFWDRSQQEILIFVFPYLVFIFVISYLGQRRKTKLKGHRTSSSVENDVEYFISLQAPCDFTHLFLFLKYFNIGIKTIALHWEKDAWFSARIVKLNMATFCKSSNIRPLDFSNYLFAVKPQRKHGTTTGLSDEVRSKYILHQILSKRPRETTQAAS